ncbi:MAG: HEPN domain-containing protein [Methanobacterium sp.]|jgi:uncharacterized protein (UPF0332 family)
MKYQFERCKDRGKIVQTGIDSQLVEKELEESRYDLESAEKSVNEGNYKWTIVQSYYSMFHAFRGLLFSRGYREKSHICLKFAIEAIFVDNGLISEDILEDFDFAMRARERADYSYIYNENLAHDMLESTKKLISEVENLL